MSISKIATLAALCSLALCCASTASATTYVREQTSTTGPVLPSGSSFSADLLTGTQAVLKADVGTITCPSSSFRATVGAQVLGNVTAWTFTNCTDTVPLFTFTSCSMNFQPQHMLNATGMGGTMTINSSGSFSLVCSGSATCTFSNTFETTVGTWSEVGGASRLAFSNARVYSSLCGSGGITATYAPLVTTGTNVPVFLNNI